MGLFVTWFAKSWSSLLPTYSCLTSFRTTCIWGELTLQHLSQPHLSHLKFIFRPSPSPPGPSFRTPVPWSTPKWEVPIEGFPWGLWGVRRGYFFCRTSKLCICHGQLDKWAQWRWGWWWWRWGWWKANNCLTFTFSQSISNIPYTLMQVAFRCFWSQYVNHIVLSRSKAMKCFPAGCTAEYVFRFYIDSMCVCSGSWKKTNRFNHTVSVSGKGKVIYNIQLRRCKLQCETGLRNSGMWRFFWNPIKRIKLPGGHSYSKGERPRGNLPEIPDSYSKKSLKTERSIIYP